MTLSFDNDECCCFLTQFITKIWEGRNWENILFVTLETRLSSMDLSIKKYQMQLGLRKSW